MVKKFRAPLNAADYADLGNFYLEEGILDGEGHIERGEDRKKEMLISKNKNETVAVKNLINYMMNIIKRMREFEGYLPQMDEHLRDFIVDFELDKQKIDDNLIDNVTEKLKTFRSNYGKLRDIINDLTINGEIFLKFLGKVYGKLYKRIDHLKGEEE